MRTPSRNGPGAIAALAAVILSGCAATPPLLRLEPAALLQRCGSDLRVVEVYRAGLKSTVDFVASRPDVFPTTRPAEPRMLGREQRAIVRSTWRRLLDYQLALDSVGKFHSSFHRLSHQPQKDRSFLVRYSAFLAGYRHALELIPVLDADPAIGTVLNEPMPELGLEGGTYDRYKFRFLNVARATELAAFGVIHALQAEQPFPAINSAVTSDAARVWAAGAWTGPKLTVANGLAILGRAGKGAWFPVQAGVSEWMGDTLVYRKGRALISPAQIQALAAQLEPGDVLLTRREWYLSNIGLPGYWPHAALYVGTAAQRRRYFEEFRGLEGRLQSGNREFYAMSLRRQPDGHLPRVIEAISEGVSLTTIEHSAAADSLVALRPRLPKQVKAAAIARAFEYCGRPYDFDFDFLTDRELVCTELVYKCYEPSRSQSGLRLPTTTMLGRRVMPANLIARQFDETFASPGRQFDLVLFLDGREWQGGAVEASVAEFRRSWRRPKWHIWSDPGR